MLGPHNFTARNVVAPLRVAIVKHDFTGIRKTITCSETKCFVVAAIVLAKGANDWTGWFCYVIFLVL